MVVELRSSSTTFKESAVVARTLGNGTVVSRTFLEFFEDVTAVADRLRAVGVGPQHVLGLQGPNSYEWLVWDLATLEIGAVLQVFSEESNLEIDKIIRDQQLAGFVSGLDDSLTVTPTQISSRSIKFNPSAEKLADPDVHSRVYSSGTSGNQKGLEISRVGTEHLVRKFMNAFMVGPTDTQLIFLPLSNYQQRMGVYLSLISGASLVLSSFHHVFGDLTSFHPTFLVAPPLFLETFLATHGSAATDRSSITSALGGRIRFMLTGMAPSKARVLEAYASLGITVLEAYGLTESGIISWNLPGNNRIGTVGLPVDRESVLFSDDSEVLVRPALPLTKRYFDHGGVDASTVFRPDGVIATGDLGLLDGEHLRLLGRKKDLLITSNGRKYHPAKIETELATLHAVRDSMVSSKTDGSVVAALIVDHIDDASIQALLHGVRNINRTLDPDLRITDIVVNKIPFSEHEGFVTRNLKPIRTDISKLAEDSPSRGIFSWQHHRV
jgi:long-subunit acyl-CoA synthetase (AMP-forming)